MTVFEGPIHLVGAGGMHMSAIGQLLLEQGVVVTGSDLRLTPFTARLSELGATIHEGHAATNIGDARLVVTTAAAKDDNPEILEARRRGIPVILRAEMVARLMEGKRVIAVAGSHGKTTTSSLIALTLRDAGLDPMYLLGGESRDLGGHAAWGNGELCVVEADEYNRAFHEYAPDVAVITNVDADHLDYYGSAEAYEEAFAVFVRKIRPGGRLIICGDDAGARRLMDGLTGAAIDIQVYGLDPRGHWHAGNPQDSGEKVSFDLVRQGARLGSLELRLPGMHIVRNATAAAAVCIQEGVSFGDVRKAASDFTGASRRFETKGEAKGVIVIDDYSHHPTEVRALLSAARARFGNRRLIGIYQPHTYSRISYLWDDWVTCFSALDSLIVLETYAAREAPEAGRGAADLARAIATPAASYAADFSTAVRMAADLVRTGDIVFTIGAGDITDAGPMLLEVLNER